MAPPPGSVALREEGSEMGQWPLPAFLSERNLFPNSCLDARHFSSSLYATGTFQAATLVLNPRGNEYTSMCEGKLLGTPEVSSTNSFPTGFCSQKL